MPRSAVSLMVTTTLAMATTLALGEPAHYIAKPLRIPGDKQNQFTAVAMSGRSILGNDIPANSIAVVHGSNYTKFAPLDLVNFNPYAVNRNGDSVGAAYNADFTAYARYLQLADGTSTEITRLEPHGISDDRTIAGGTLDTFAPASQKDGVVTLLPTIPGAPAQGTVLAINQWNVMTGFVATPSGTSQVAKWRNNVLTLLPSLYGLPDSPTGISSNGLIVGNCGFQQSIITTHACMWRKEQVVDLGALESTFSVSRVYGVNADGVAVGESGIQNEEGTLDWYPVFFVDGALYKAKDYVQMPAGIALFRMLSINDAGEILAIGYDLFSQGPNKSYLLKPVK